MTFDYFIEIKGKVKSLELYRRIKQYNANVTDLIFLTFVYGEAKLNVLIKIIVICTKFGKVKVNLKRRS